VVRYHDAVPLLMPHTIKNRAGTVPSHYHALRRNVRDGAWFACVSEATRADLLSVLPEAEPRTVTIPNMVLERPEAESRPRHARARDRVEPQEPPCCRTPAARRWRRPARLARARSTTC
jgi:hypothetical protein